MELFKTVETFVYISIAQTRHWFIIVIRMKLSLKKHFKLRPFQELFTSDMTVDAHYFTTDTLTSIEPPYMSTIRFQTQLLAEKHLFILIREFN